MANNEMSVSKMEATATAQVDEKLYSRQLYVMGHEAQRRMMESSALIVGLSGLGVEVAKNCILAGLSHVTLCDPCSPTSFDLGGNFYLTEAHVKENLGRAELCRPKLAELNPTVTVDIASSVKSLHATEALLDMTDGMSVVVITVPLATPVLNAMNEKCRAVGASFIYALTHGVFGRIFCDFGAEFTVSDKDGENPATSQVESILPSNPALVEVLEDQGQSRHGLQTGDFVTFSRVTGLDGVLDQNPSKEYEVRVNGPDTFELLGVDASACSAPATQGYITQVKKPINLHFKIYAEALENPGPDMMLSDFAKFDRPPVLHLAFRALAAYAENHAMELPSPGDDVAALEVYDIAKSLDKEEILMNSDGSERLISQLASGSRAILSPMCAAVGGIVGQEVMKACSGKFTPIPGFFYFDADECLQQSLLPIEEVAPTGTSRYDSPTAVFGKSLQDKILNLRYFLVGAGAVGCEMLKNWALMGVGCGSDGCVHLTDMDRIEKSNLSRQFLFRNSDIDTFKSSTACKSARAMNPSLRITAYREKVGTETEDLFGDDFYTQLHGVCTALDNVDARLYIDTRCLFYELPMLESGTLGTKGNTQVVVPHLTESYGATRDPPEKDIPVCTLKNFPNQIHHTLQWARDLFEGEFKQSAEDMKAYRNTPNYIETLDTNQATKADKLRSLLHNLMEERPSNFDDCIIWARRRFQDLFHNQIRQMLYNFPPNLTSAAGIKFWSGSKRCPKPLEFDMQDKCSEAEMRNHLDFVIAAANLRAEMFGITKGRTTDEEYFTEVLQNAIVPDFEPKDGVKIAETEAEANEQEEQEAGETSANEMERGLASLPKPAELEDLQILPIEFDKDLDDHMLFVTACSNLRALNYSIPTADTHQSRAHQSRAIAGRIIPAIATTTALVTGLISLELYKIVGSSGQQLKREALKNSFVNLAIPFVTHSEPTRPPTTKTLVRGKEWNWTAWDSISVAIGDVTLQEFMDHFAKEYNVDVIMVSHGKFQLYSSVLGFGKPKEIQERRAEMERRRKMKMSQLVMSISTKEELPPHQLFLTFEIFACDKDDGSDVDLPHVKFRFR